MNIPSDRPLTDFERYLLGVLGWNPPYLRCSHCQEVLLSLGGFSVFGRDGYRGKHKPDCPLDKASPFMEVK